MRLLAKLGYILRRGPRIYHYISWCYAVQAFCSLLRYCVLPLANGLWTIIFGVGELMLVNALRGRFLPEPGPRESVAFFLA